jgi:KipI family sensor histidine kinase inhibitor
MLEWPESESSFNWRLFAYGESDWLVQWDSPVERSRWLDRYQPRLEAEIGRSLLEYVPGGVTLLLRFLAPVSQVRVEGWLHTLARSRLSEDTPGVAARKHVLPVCYDGEDLEFVASEHGLRTEEVVQIHSSTVYTVSFLGFSPGFPYLDPLDPRLHTPRRHTPRTRIPAGSIAIGGRHTGIYPAAMPGGWHLLGRTTVELLFLPAACTAKPDLRKIFLLHPGDRVSLIPVSSRELAHA